MKRTMLIILVGMITLPFVAGGQQIYQWVDEKGTVHFTDDISLVPEKYQDQIKEKKIPKEPASPPPVTSTRDKALKEPQEATERKDILGRGEDWWRDKAREWKEKLTKSQKNYEAAVAALKAKEKELEDAKFKPKSFQRRLQDEVKALEGKMNEQKRQVEEAKNMLEKVLPKQAEDYRADPSWLRTD
jgi:chromosome segregation ATPase